MNTVYKIESYSHDVISKLAQTIWKNKGRCAVTNRIIITDFCFQSEQAMIYVPFISKITDDLSQSDWYHWYNEFQIATKPYVSNDGAISTCKHWTVII
jgi:hypothetical protein